MGLSSLFSMGKRKAVGATLGTTALQRTAGGVPNPSQLFLGPWQPDLHPSRSLATHSRTEKPPVYKRFLFVVSPLESLHPFCELVLTIMEVELNCC